MAERRAVKWLATLGAVASLGCAAPTVTPERASTAHAGPAACGFESGEIALWSGEPPSGATLPVESTTERSTDPAVHDRSISGVSRPTLVPFLAERPNGAAALVLPGGGYHHLSWDKEGVDIARWLNGLGVSAFVLKYRLPTDYPEQHDVALIDAERALRLIKQRGVSCCVDPERVGVIGFSAGGHLASQLATRFKTPLLPPTDDVERVDARPAFAVLLYPVISMHDELAHVGSKTALLGPSPTPGEVDLRSSELQVSRDTPPTFIATSEQDKSVNPDNSRRFGEALARAGVPHALHLYRDGGHGTGIRNASGDMAAWPEQSAAWLEAEGIIGGSTRATNCGRRSSPRPTLQPPTGGSTKPLSNAPR